MAARPIKAGVGNIYFASINTARRSDMSTSSGYATNERTFRRFGISVWVVSASNLQQRGP